VSNRAELDPVRPPWLTTFCLFMLQTHHRRRRHHFAKKTRN